MMTSEAQMPGRATPPQAARAVFWSFFGIRKRAAYDKNAVSLQPVQAIVAGIIGAIIFVLSPVMLVQFIIS